MLPPNPVRTACKMLRGGAEPTWMESRIATGKNSNRRAYVIRCGLCLQVMGRKKFRGEPYVEGETDHLRRHLEDLGPERLAAFLACSRMIPRTSIGTRDFGKAVETMFDFHAVPPMGIQPVPKRTESAQFWLKLRRENQRRNT